ncbi:CusA/CzcA family heavy metal efflux RND transporter [Flavobacterium sp.]|uniref:CusA/CzcA family heavy metal efflux RND transporter n=1 Tax=Flavobacterium sp. TaxID=239 RepID=UPI003529C867
MLAKIITFSLKNKLIILLFTFTLFGFGLYSLSKLSIGAVPDITNNQIQIITTSQNLSTQDIEQYITATIELEMANLPSLKEIRSVSKFGLSVVTVVFDEDMGTYLPRQLVAEKIKTASEKIPESFGSPEMGPITTGLGEIYQYTLEVKPEYESKYSTTDLRTIQDWIVKRHLSGVAGVVEINTWGGYLKQYEIAINSAKLNAMNISINEVFEAIDNNNSIAGGSYIEKESQSFFIRGEGNITSLADIEQIAVKTANGIPVFIKDVAKVKFGHANRFGAITANGKGEKVLGQVMMLKGANSKQVIEDVTNRVAEVQKILPKGVYIKPALERSELVAKTTFTIAENLILGCLIVIFIVVLLLGNWRSGLVVASVIPLCLLFAITFMNIFGIDANLMSLGAIDFGIIIDGAVIIVEFIAFQITAKTENLQHLNKKDQQTEIDAITQKSTSKMMNSAVFGQLIILIVFIPILTLSGVEGKMFKPMALTFSFALIGAMLLCFTYVPVISSLVLKPQKINPKSISNRLITVLNNWYKPVITWALQNTKKVMVSAIAVFVLSVFIFSRMGGEFIPTLDEGDFVIQPVLKTGTSLGKTIEITTKIEDIILDNFSEVEQVVSRIGAAEVPTDPMSMEESDIIVKLKPKSEWENAASKDDLADKIKQAITTEIPNMELEFTQPIEMRFNELISGTRSDVAVKIFGDNLEILAKKAHEIEEAIKNVEGAADIIVEKTEGLPQMLVKFNRSKLARYGLNTKDVNNYVSLAFAGKVSGQVFEGEKRFDMVVRLDNTNRKSIDDLKNLFISLPNQQQIPLQEVAEVTYTTGPAKISRDNTKRRIVIGINVRNRDMQSVVNDIRKIIATKIDLPPGYEITYGGQFENLQSAKARLLIAVPIALLLIFILLYFAFHSVKEALMIYSAIPLATVGGIFFLALRDLPFSISAGVGFIALFGIAVLNGIVLIEHFNEMKQNTFNNIDEMIIKTATDRLRPVLLTAAAAALGFLPMAISASAGAEVQRPLATVVIGGLITATILTMVVLPVLFKIVETKSIKIRVKKKTAIVGFLLFSVYSNAQEIPNELFQLQQVALENNNVLKAKQLGISKAEETTKLAFTLDKTSVYYAYDQNNLAINNEPLKVFGVQQNFDFPTLYKARKNYYKANVAVENANFEIEKNNLFYQVALAYNGVVYWKNKKKLYQKLDSLYQSFSKGSNRRFELGETNYLEKITAEAKYRKIETELFQIEKQILAQNEQLQAILQTDSTIAISNQKLDKINTTETLNGNIYNSYYQSIIELNKTDISLQKQNWLPSISGEYFQGKNTGLSSSLYGFQVGLTIPIVFSGTAKKVKIAQLEVQKSEAEQQNAQQKITHFIQQKNQELESYTKAIQYYETSGKNLSKEILKVAEMSYKHGEIDFFQYVQSLENAISIEVDYLDNLIQYNQLLLQKNYLIFN